MVKLNERQRRFADEYIRLGEITQAAVNAGYSIKTAKQIGQENLTKPAIKMYVEKRLNELKKESIAEQDEILQFLTSVMRGEATGTALVGIGQGAQTVEQLPPSVSERTKAAVDLGKRYAMWTDKHQVDGIAPVKIINNIPLSDD